MARRTMSKPNRRCRDLRKDRLKGAEAEERFCEIMRSIGYEAERLQPRAKERAATKEIRGERIVIGDVDVKTPSGEVFNVEVKSKYPNRFGSYGMEEYRIDHYMRYEKLTEIPVIYAIEKTGDSEDKKLPIEKRKWFWKSFRALLKYPYKTFRGLTWMDSGKKKVPICYFKEEWFNDMETDWWE